MISRRAWNLGALSVLLRAATPGQVIEFENNGLHYQTLTRNGITVMYAHMAVRVKEYAILQVAVSNGSKGPYAIKPEDFVFQRQDGGPIRAVAAKTVVNMLIDKGGRNEVIKLVAAYENALYGISKMKANNGYEARRQAALAYTTTKLKAAAAASAIAFVQIKLQPGDSTDGAVFFPTEHHMMGSGRLVVQTTYDTFEFKEES